MREEYLELSNYQSHKFYQMNQVSPESFVSRWGRIENYPRAHGEKTYSMADFEKMYQKKLAKGYYDA